MSVIARVLASGVSGIPALSRFKQMWSRAASTAWNRT
jgi:hypothetical protein